MKNSLLHSSKTNPLTWWLVGLSFALTASLSGNILVLVGIAIISMSLVKLFRGDAPWSRSIKFYLQLAATVIVLRILFRIIFNLEVAPENTLLNLPGFEINLGFGSTLQLFGPISALSFYAAMTDGVRLAAIILSVGMANSLANPRKLLKATPGALYEVATAISISINLAPQLISSLTRVRRARALRGSAQGVKSLPGIVIPVLEDTIGQSLDLAASMSARGFGRKGSVNNSRLLTSRFVGLGALTLLASGIALLLISPNAQLIDLGLITVGFTLAVLYVKMSALGSSRTTFRPQPWRVGDGILLVGAALILVFAFSGVFAK